LVYVVIQKVVLKLFVKYRKGISFLVLGLENKKISLSIVERLSIACEIHLSKQKANDVSLFVVLSQISSCKAFILAGVL